MQDNWQEYDRQLRSALEDAGVKAPRRVWRAVSSRLDEGKEGKGGWFSAPFFRFSVPVFAAVAAVVVAAILLKPAFNTERPLQGPAVAEVQPAVPSDESSFDAAVQAGQPAEAVDAEAVSFGEGLLAEAAVPASGGVRPDASGELFAAASGPGKSVSKDAAASGSRKNAPSSGPGNTGLGVKPGTESPAAGSERVPDTCDADASSVQSGFAEDSAAAPAGTRPAARPEVPAVEEDNSAIWARIEASEESLSQRPRLSALYAQGGLGGNDSNLRYSGSGISHMAPGGGSEDAGISEASLSTYGVPFTVGLGARVALGPKLSLGSGLEYSLLTRTFTGSYISSSSVYEGSIRHTLHYVGIPVNAYWQLFGSSDGLFSLYAWGGGTAEICVGNSYRLMDTGLKVRDAAGSFQFSAGLGAGVEFRLSDKLGLYIDPSVRYYFHGAQPKSLRTDKPLMFTVDAGLRFRL